MRKWKKNAKLEEVTFKRMPVSVENNGNSAQIWNPAIIEADPLDWTGTRERDKIPFMERFGQPGER
jgi:hypothetical protein